MPASAPDKTPDVAVLGGGIIGALSAYEIAKTGRSVLLLDPRSLGSGASGNSAAMLEYQLDFHRGEPFRRLARASMDLFRPLHAEIQALTGLDFQLDFCGILQIALTAEDATFLSDQVDQQKREGLPAEWLNATDVRRRYPALAIATEGAALFAGDGQVDGYKFLEAALEAARKKGVVIRESVGPFELTRENGLEIKGNLVDISPRSVVVAAGAWTDQALARLGFRTGIEPIRGQLIVHETAAAPFPHPVYTRTGSYIAPKRTGYTLAGTTVERAGFDSSTTETGRNAIKQTTEALVPGLADLPVRRMTAGLRPRSPDELPLLGFLPDAPDIFVAAGHYRNGVMLAPVTARIVAAAITGGSFPVDIAPFSLSRCLTQT